ncbi:uncharacterized protein [Drosophila virilis]|uniref:CHCH domain-containing protein n=1 Tax=Drosophila virilis TaxID=7244 RepID=B4MAB6_DROVI|nr:uncharacterized protein LOC6634518 [Drosophila virilis]EDW66175.1 uncharacterized protein Dvir_GJ15879 [Drosophila virilis]
MGDRLEAAPPPKELPGKAKTQPKSVMPSKPKKGSVLSAIEDIQRMSPEAICLEFDRLVEHTKRHFKEEPQMPCTGVATQLLRCLQKHRQQSFQCFDAMDEYRQCIGLATQEHIDQLAEEERQRQQLPVATPKAMPAPYMQANTKERGRRNWYKPWTWVR